MRALLLTILVLLSTIGQSHDARLAYFNLSRDGDLLHLEMKIDKHDLIKAIGLYKFVDADSMAMKDEIEAYILDNLSFSFNRQPTEICISSISSDQDYYFIHSLLGHFKGKILYVDVFNTCLINSVDKHSNIVRANFYNKHRSFRLDKDRIETTMDYSDY